MSMEAEYDAILSEDFPGPEHVSLSHSIEQHHEQQQEYNQDQVLDPVHSGQNSPFHDSDPNQHEQDPTESHDDGGGNFTDGKVVRGQRKKGLSGLSAEERKSRQKAQNRKAAERSRNKKKQEVSSLEVSVNEIQAENVQLRARLAQLLSSRNTATPVDSAAPDTTPSTTETGLDYVYLSKIQNELSSAKSTLLERELELAQLKGAESSADVDVLRHLLLSHHTTLTSLTAEAGSLESMITHLRNERDALSKQADVISKELEARKQFQGLDSEEIDAAQNNAGRSVGVERALLDIRGMVDEAVRSWEQTSVLPAQRDGGNGIIHEMEIETHGIQGQ